MTIQARLESWLQAKGETYSPERLEKLEEPCYTCARGEELKLLVLKAAIAHLHKKQEREGIMGRIVLVTNQACPPCEEVERTLKPLIDEGEIEVINYSECEECDREAIGKAGIRTFPSLAIRSEEGLVVSALSLAPKVEEAEETVAAVEPEEAEAEEE